jgi:PP-loop superfamily ATP-utilizing enzyme
VHPYVEASIDKAAVYALAAELGLGDLERLPAQPCLASRVETGIAIAAEDLAFIDAVESRLAARLGREAVAPLPRRRMPASSSSWGRFSRPQPLQTRTKSRARRA